jgi:multidrug efflux pump subunit AcrA (membrane-fusion protein)
MIDRIVEFSIFDFRFSIFILAFALLIFTTACGGSKAQNNKAENQNTQSAALPQSFDVTTAAAIKRELPRYFEATGSLAGDEQTDVAPLIGGKVASVSVDLGSFVKRGDVLAKLDDRDARLRLEQARAQLDQQAATVRQAEERLGLKSGEKFDPLQVPEVKNARAALNLAEKQFRRYEKLLDSGDVSRSTFDIQKAQYEQAQQLFETIVNGARQNYAALQTARAAYQVTKAQVDQAQKAVNDTVILAPIAGFVADRPVDVGEYVTTSSKIATIVRTNPLRLKIDVPEQAVPEVKIGQTVEIRVSAYSDKIFNGHIARVSPNINQASRTLTVEAEVNNSEGLLKPGQFTTARILQQKTEGAVMIPLRAVRTEGNVSRVFIIKDGKAEQRLVQLGQAAADMVEVKIGLKEGEKIATSNVDKLTDGSLIKE